jgi:hypothetical protein
MIACPARRVAAVAADERVTRATDPHPHELGRTIDSRRPANEWRHEPPARDNASGLGLDEMDAPPTCHERAAAGGTHVLH